MEKTVTTIFRLALALVFTLGCDIEARAWDSEPDANGKYDLYYDRPTYFPDWKQPNDWPNFEIYVVVARFGTNGPRVENYEVAVYDQDNILRHCNRSMAKDDNACVLTIRGQEGQQFHCKIIYGDFDNPTIVDAPETFGFKTNDVVGSSVEPFYLSLPGRTYLSETSTELPVNETGADVTVIRTITADEWGTICLPFAMTEEQVKTAFGDDVELGNFTGCETTLDEDGETVSHINVKFEVVTAIEANHPYIIKVSNDISEFEADGVDIIVPGEGEVPSVDCDELNVKIGSMNYNYYNSFIGNYTNDFLVPKKNLFLSGGQFWYSTGSTKMMGFRGYFNFYDVLPETEQSGARISMSFDNGTSGVKSVAMASQQTGRDGQPYDLQGRKVSGLLKKGLYIINGKKYLVR